MTRRLAYPIVIAVCALPRIVVLVHERASILGNFEKSHILAQLYLRDGTFGYVPGHPSAYTQPLYGWFLIPIFWIAGFHWWSVGTVQILVAVATSIVVFETGRRFLSARIGLIGGRDRDAPALPRLARRPRQPRDPRPAARRGDVRADPARRSPGARPGSASRSASSRASPSSRTRGCSRCPLILAAASSPGAAPAGSRRVAIPVLALRRHGAVGRSGTRSSSAASRSRPTAAPSGRRTTSTPTRRSRTAGGSTRCPTCRNGS